MKNVALSSSLLAFFLVTSFAFAGPAPSKPQPCKCEGDPEHKQCEVDKGKGCSYNYLNPAGSCTNGIPNPDPEHGNQQCVRMNPDGPCPNGEECVCCYNAKKKTWSCTNSSGGTKGCTDVPGFTGKGDPSLILKCICSAEAVQTSY